MITLTFQGGPRDGKTKEYPRDPILVTCASEAQEQGLHGLYKTGGSLRQRATTGPVTAHWHPLPGK